jgi:hypothetical protein
MVCHRRGGVARRPFIFPLSTFRSSWRNVLNYNRAVSRRNEFVEKKSLSKVRRDRRRPDEQTRQALLLPGCETTGPATDAASLNRPAPIAMPDIGLLRGGNKFAMFEN